jgi:hypothetical protein
VARSCSIEAHHGLVPHPRKSRGASDLNPSGGMKASCLTGAGGGGGLSCEKPKEKFMGMNLGGWALGEEMA